MEKDKNNEKAIEQTAPQQQDDRELAQEDLDAVSGAGGYMLERR